MKIFKNAGFVSCGEPNRVFSVLAEDKGRIAFIGDGVPDELKGAETLDLNGACVVPSFIDTHIHFESYALFHSGLDCRDVADFGELGDLIKAHLASHSEKVTIGFGCSAHTVKEKRLPERQDLDGITDHPIMIVKYDGHAAVANSALIKRLPQKVLKTRGFEEKSGWFFLDSFYTAVNHITGSVSPVAVFRNLAAASDALAEKGISGVHTVEGVGFPLDMDVDIMRLAAHGLPQRFRIFFQTMDVGKASKRGLKCIGGCFATALDGCLGSQDAALREPYANDPNNKGTLFYTQETVDDFIKKANRAGLQTAVHAIGDAAVEQALNAFEAALKDFPRKDHRHIIIHSDLIDKRQMDRAAAAGIHFAVQTPFLHWRQEPMEYEEGILGPRANLLIPVKSMLNNGLVLANGSDGPTTLPDPLFGIYAACNHPNPDESIPVLDALKMHTSWAAGLGFEEETAGTLEVDKTADFVVLDRNILETPAGKLNEIKITDHYLAGKRFEGIKKGAGSLFGRSVWNGLFH